MDGVRPGERARRVRELDDPGDVRLRPHRVRRDGEGDDAGAVGELPLEVVEVEREVVVQAGAADDDAEVVLELEPRRHVRVVVEQRHDDLVARAQGSREGPCEHEVERGHAGAEDRLVRMAAEEAARRLARPVDQRVGADARREGRTGVRVVLAQVARDRVDHRVRHLSAGCAVEEGGRPVEGREARPHRLHVERRRAHATSSPPTVQR
ncbi:MAG TPA: hypothetical protein VNT23_04605 [Gaiellaceae bacterium]|nr:hypothetical protein [Gaiellaceae bacterium]